MCDQFKTYQPSAFRRCYLCRTLAIQKALRDKVPFGGLCVNGIYEYTHPIVMGEAVAGMIFIGNILEGDAGLQRIRQRIKNEAFPIDTLEHTVTAQDCRSIAQLLEAYILFLLKEYPAKGRPEKLLINNMTAYVTANLGFEIRMAEIAALFHYNPRYLGRLFKQETGVTLREFINQKRIEAAKERLRATTRSVIEIAGEVGFENVTYFNRVFKQAVGMTPTQYRRPSAESGE